MLGVLLALISSYLRRQADRAPPESLTKILAPENLNILQQAAVQRIAPSPYGNPSPLRDRVAFREKDPPRGYISPGSLMLLSGLTNSTRNW